MSPMPETYLPGDQPRGDQGLDAVESPRSGDSDVQRVLDEITKRQKQQAEKIAGLTPADLAFALMRRVPREDWNTPLSRLGHWPRGSTVAEIKRTPALRDFTTAQAILQLFALDDEAKRRAGSIEE